MGGNQSTSSSSKDDVWTESDDAMDESSSSPLLEIGHGPIAMMLDFISRKHTNELAPYRLVCQDFETALNLYAAVFY